MEIFRRNLQDTRFLMTPDELKTKDVHRDTTIYLVMRYSGLCNRGIGELFGGMHYTAGARCTPASHKNRAKTGNS
jgi:hypothetical protein